MPTPQPLPSRLIGALFVERGLVSESQIRVALEIQEESGQQLGQILVERFGVSRRELASVVAEQWAKLGGSAGPEDSASWRRLGEIFVERGFVSQEELDNALKRQRQTGERLGEALVAQGVISKFELAGALAEQMAALEGQAADGSGEQEPRTEATVHQLPMRDPDPDVPFGTVADANDVGAPEAMGELRSLDVGAAQPTSEEEGVASASEVSEPSAVEVGEVAAVADVGAHAGHEEHAEHAEHEVPFDAVPSVVAADDAQPSDVHAEDPEPVVAALAEPEPEHPAAEPEPVDGPVESDAVSVEPEPEPEPHHYSSDYLPAPEPEPVEATETDPGDVAPEPAVVADAAPETAPAPAEPVADAAPAEPVVAAEAEPAPAGHEPEAVEGHVETFDPPAEPEPRPYSYDYLPELEPEESPTAEPAAACFAFAPTTSGYRLVPLEVVPVAGDTIDVPDVGERFVLRVGTSPLPLDGTVWAFLEEPVTVSASA